MGDNFNTLLEASIKLELHVARLYLVFYHSQPQDASFWWTLALEEQNHAALLRSIQDVFVPRGSVPEKLIFDNLEILRQTNEDLSGHIAVYNSQIPTREQAFNLALRIENSAAELHYQNFMGKLPDSDLEQVFQQLNEDDKDHAGRIRTYMHEHGIAIDV
ncbi:MAG: hypothetical protein RBR43_01170 [Desulfuromonadaceae bacterium]|nr:hypothetical protein [Desulfuromonadaceae bacterium]